MIDTYKGESIGKKRARFHFWMEACKLGKHRADCPPRIVVLASREGGDISVLTGLGCPLGWIVAVDRCPEAVRACREKWPEADVRLGDVADFVDDTTSILFLDFCAPLCGATFETVKRCVRKMPPGALLGVAILKGRESNAPMNVRADCAATNRQMRRSVRAQARHLEPAHRRFIEARYGLGQMSARDALVGHGDDRFHTLTSAALDTHDIETIQYIEYQSATERSHGVPMIIGLFRLHCLGVFRDEDGVPIPSKKPIMVHRFRSKPEHLRNEVLHTLWSYKWRNPIEDVARVYALPRQTIAAWKAHATRGTYDAKEAADAE